MTLDKVYKYANSNRKTVMWVLLALVAALTIPMLLLNFESNREGLTTGDADLDAALETLEAITNQTENMKEDSGFEGMEDGSPGSPGSPEPSSDNKDDKLKKIKRTVNKLKDELDTM